MDVARSVFGLLLAAQGCQKLFGWFRGPGIGGTATFFESLGFHPGPLFVIAAALGESGGGILLALGLFQPASAAAVISVMSVAIATVHWGKGLLAPAGVEHPFLYLTAASALAFTGPGAYSLDALLGHSLVDAASRSHRPWYGRSRRHCEPRAPAYEHSSCPTVGAAKAESSPRLEARIVATHGPDHPLRRMQCEP